MIIQFDSNYGWYYYVFYTNAADYEKRRKPGLHSHVLYESVLTCHIVDGNVSHVSKARHPDRFHVDRLAYNVNQQIQRLKQQGIL